MNSQAARQAIQTGKMPANVDWYDGFLGLFYCLVLWGFAAVVLFTKTTANPIVALISFSAVGVLFFYGLHSLFTERNLKVLTTSLNAATNRQLVQAAFHHLGWQYRQPNQQVIIATLSQKWFAAGDVDIIALLADDKIYLNARSKSSFRGRLPFFTSRNNRFLHLLISTIKQSANSF